MKRQMRKVRKKLPMLWDESMDFEVAIRPLPSTDADADLDGKIIMFPLPVLARKYRHNPLPPLAA